MLTVVIQPLRHQAVRIVTSFRLFEGQRTPLAVSSANAQVNAHENSDSDCPQRIIYETKANYTFAFALAKLSVSYWSPFCRLAGCVLVSTHSVAVLLVSRQHRVFLQSPRSPHLPPLARTRLASNDIQTAVAVRTHYWRCFVRIVSFMSCMSHLWCFISPYPSFVSSCRPSAPSPFVSTPCPSFAPAPSPPRSPAPGPSPPGSPPASVCVVPARTLSTYIVRVWVVFGCILSVRVAYACVFSTWVFPALVRVSPTRPCPFPSNLLARRVPVPTPPANDIRTAVAVRRRCWRGFVLGFAVTVRL